SKFYRKKWSEQRETENHYWTLTPNRRPKLICTETKERKPTNLERHSYLTSNGKATVELLRLCFTLSIRSTSNGLPMLFPARSSIVVSTTIRWRPPCHGLCGVKSHSRSAAPSRASPETGWSSLSRTRIMRSASAWSSGRGNRTRKLSRDRP